MRRIRTLSLATIALLLVALASPAGTPLGPRPAGTPARSVASGSLAALELGVLPVRDRSVGEVGPVRPEDGPSGIHGLLALALTTGGPRQLRGGPPGAPPARRPVHHTVGAPRGPPATLLPS
jgi:hypothetical protein